MPCLSLQRSSQGIKSTKNEDENWTFQRMKYRFPQQFTELPASVFTMEFTPYQVKFQYKERYILTFSKFSTLPKYPHSLLAGFTVRQADIYVMPG